MSWKYPEHKPKAGGVVEVDDLNRSFNAYAQEVSGGLNEHNWSKDTFHRTYCDEDVAIEVWQSKLAVDPSSALDDPTNDNFKIRISRGWQKITSMTVEATTEKSTLWIIGSLQHVGAWAACPQYAVQINGTVITETITGAAGQGYDAYHETWSDTLKHLTQTTFGPGLAMSTRRSVGLDALIDVPSGVHDIAIVGRVMQTNDVELNAKFSVQNRELIVLSLRR